MAAITADDVRFRIAAGRRMLYREGCDSNVGGHVSARAQEGDGFWVTGFEYLDQTRPAGMSEPHLDPKLGIRGVAECTFEFDAVRIDADNVLIIPEADSKKGAQILVEQFNPERCGNAAMCTGLAQAALDASIAHVKARNQFGRPLADFQGLQWKIADMAMQVEISRTLTWKAARAGDTGGGFPPQQDTVLAKLYSSEMVQTVTNQAIGIHGARGYSRRWPLERLFRDGRGLAIGGGTTDAMRNMLAGIVLDHRTSQRGTNGNRA